MIPLVLRAIRLAGGAIAGVLAVGVLLVVIDANEDNGLVHAVLEVGRFFADPFRRIVTLDDNDLQIAINWGIAAVAYVAVAALVAALVRAIVRAATDRSGGSRERAG